MAALVATCQGGVIISEGFDNILTLPGSGWVQTNNSEPIGSTNWFQGSGAVFPASAGASDAYIAASYHNTEGAGTISNWLISPVITMADGDILSFYTLTQDGSTWLDRLEVRFNLNDSGSDVGSTSDSVGDFSTLALSVNPALTTGGYPEVWTQHFVTVGGLGAPVSGRFAFRYYVTNGGPSGANSDYIGIDTVSYDSQLGEVPEPATIGLAAIGLGVLALRRRRAR